MEEKETKGVAVVVPSLNPTGRLTDTVSGLLAAGFTDILLVNDGSRPETLRYFEEASARPGVTLLQHEVNRGKGAAMKTAFAWLLEHRPDCPGVVTVDGDGQHHPEDAMACAAKMLREEKVILGCRDFSRPEVPPKSLMGNRITCAVFKIFCGMSISDTQTGLRGIPLDSYTVPGLLTLPGERYEYEMEMLMQSRTLFPAGVTEVPIETLKVMLPPAP